MADGLSVTVSGEGAISSALARIAARVDAAVASAVGDAAHGLEAEVKKGFTTSHAKGTPTPSAPGFPPAVVTGTLRRSITTAGPTRQGFGTYVAQVGPTVVYARVQELGGGKSHLPARPYMQPVFQQFLARNGLRDRIARAVDGALRV